MDGRDRRRRRVQVFVVGGRVVRQHENANHAAINHAPDYRLRSYVTSTTQSCISSTLFHLFLPNSHT